MEKDLKVKHIGKDEKTRELCRKLKETTGEERQEVQCELLKLHSGMINKMAYRYSSETFCPSEDGKDALGEISLYILSLFDKYDTEGPTAFSTYATISLTGVMKNWKKGNLLIPLPNSADKQWVAANSGKETYLNPTNGKEENILFSIRAMVNGVFSLDFPSEDQKRISEGIRCERDDFKNFLDEESLAAALSSLTEREAAIVMGYYIDDKSYKQIAREFGCTHQAIGQQMNRARRKLKSYYLSNA